MARSPFPRTGSVGPAAWAELARGPAALTVPGDVIAGAVSACRPLGRRVVGLAAASTCLYWAGMALNDYADRETDARERSHRPVPSGRVRPGTALAIAAGCTAGGLGLAALSGGRRSLCTAVPLAALVWAYDLSLKSTPLGPAAMAGARALDVLLGATAPGGPETEVALRRALRPAALMAVHTGAVTVLSRREVEGAHPALPAATLAVTAAITAAAAAPQADLRHATLHNATTPTPHPRGATRRLLFGGLDTPAQGASAVLAGLYGVVAGAAQYAAVRDPRPDRIQRAVRGGIHAMVPLQASLAARAGAVAAAVSVSALLPLARRLGRRVSVT
ncbi:SCO3242 family prenyltransferase [Streptomyces sp. NPDC016172]|uniref:SCO3242 family prenyltransferase n=1 Tax=Streptomyces sp. NPDC016172 TaxID=3364964 RepID=UPI00370290E6